MNADTKDWPLTLRINAASVELAEAMYRAQCQAFGPASGDFKLLPASHRRAYIDSCGMLLRLLSPITPAEIVRGTLPTWIATVARHAFKVVK